MRCCQFTLSCTCASDTSVQCWAEAQCDDNIHVTFNLLRYGLHLCLYLITLVELDLVVELGVVLLVDVVVGLERGGLVTNSVVGGGPGQLLNLLKLLLGKVNG